MDFQYSRRKIPGGLRWPSTPTFVVVPDLEIQLHGRALAPVLQPAIAPALLPPLPRPPRKECNPNQSKQRRGKDHGNHRFHW